MKLSKDKISLIVANLLPLVGIAFFDWSLFNFLFLYWLESAVIGFYFILKMIKGAQFRGGAVRAMLLGQSIFFVFHYGAFMFGHLMFILFVAQKSGSMMSFSSTGLIFLVISLMGLFISHGISYKQNFIEKKEYENFGNLILVRGPYDRIVVMHLVVFFGSFLVSTAGLYLYFVVILKIFVDYWIHAKSHERGSRMGEMAEGFKQAISRSNPSEILAVREKNMQTEDFAKMLNDWSKKNN